MNTPRGGLGRIRANGIDFAYLEEGSGPLLLLLHGFPDTAHGWDTVRPLLARGGYRVVVPFMRGYAPSGLATDGRYDNQVLGEDVIALIEALGAKDAVVVGHDWGAAAAYAAAGLAPERVRKLVTVAVPHPAMVKPSLGLMWRMRHFVRFKLPGALGRLSRNGFAMVDELVGRWSPAWQAGPEETADVKRAFAAPGSAAAAVEYYRQTTPKLAPALRAKIKVPTLVVAGKSDGVLFDHGIYERARRRFEGPYEVEWMSGGHFLHREEPGRFAEVLLGWLGRG